MKLNQHSLIEKMVMNLRLLDVDEVVGEEFEENASSVNLLIKLADLIAPYYSHLDKLVKY